MGEREITARSDVYALGCVTYEMLVGDPPFTGSTAQAIIAKVMTEKPARSRGSANGARRGGGRRPHRAGEAAGRSLRDRGGVRGGAARPRGTGRTRISTARTRARTSAARLERAAPRSRAARARRLATAARSLAAWKWRRPPSAPRRGSCASRFRQRRAADQLTGLQHRRRLTRRSDARLRRHGEDRRQQLMFRRWTMSPRGRCPGTEDAATRSFRPTVAGSPSCAATSSTRSPSTAGARAAGHRSGNLQRRQLVSSGVIVVSGNTALYTIPERGGAARLLGDGPAAGELFQDAPLVLDDAKA